jgi:hypothetical protein
MISYTYIFIWLTFGINYVAEFVRSVVLPGVTVMIAVVWKATLCGVIQINRRLGGT